MQSVLTDINKMLNLNCKVFTNWCILTNSAK